MLHNTGQSLVFRPDTGPKHSLAVNVSAGPLAYRYQIEEVFLHYGTDNSHGSEHRIQGNAFPAEVFQFPSGPFGFLFTKERKKKDNSAEANQVSGLWSCTNAAAHPLT